MREASLIAQSLPTGVQDQVRADLKGTRRVCGVERMAGDGRGASRTSSCERPISKPRCTLFWRSPRSDESQKLAQSRALTAVENVFENRRYRIAISRTEIDPIQWIVVLLLSATVLITIAAIHIHDRWTMAVGLFAFSTAVAICLVLLMEYDRPFLPGGFVISPSRLSRRRSGLTPHVSAMPPRSPDCAPLSRPWASARYSWGSASRSRREAVRSNSKASRPPSVPR